MNNIEYHILKEVYELLKTVCIKTIADENIDFIINVLEKVPIDVYVSNYRFKIYDNIIIHYKNTEDTETFYEFIAIILKELIEDRYEEIFLKKIIDRNYFYLSSIEKNYILEISKKVLELPDEKVGNKRELLKNIIKEYIMENKKIVLEGFMNFRIREYKDLLEKVVEVSVLSYLNLMIY